MRSLFKDLENASNNDYEIKNQGIFDLLNEYKKIDPHKRNMKELQSKIESYTNDISEINLFKETPHLIKQLILKDKESAKLYLRKYINDELYHSTIHPLGEFALEAIIIYVLGCAFNSIQESSVVRVSTIVDMLDRIVLAQANKVVDSSKEKVDRKYKSPKLIGKTLFEFMLHREVVSVNPLSSDRVVVKEKGKGHYQTNLFVFCNFDLNIIPNKLQFPMVDKPRHWHITE